jgi:hypothetical protein
VPIYKYVCEAGHEVEDLEPITAPNVRCCEAPLEDGDVCRAWAKRVPSLPSPAQFNCSMPTYRKGQ